MSIITFWNDGREQAGTTLTAVAVATRLSIERNNKILLISTSFGDTTLQSCFYPPNNKTTNLFGNSKKVNMSEETGIEGLYKLITSKKLEPDIITDYTKVIFKDRLEILPGFSEMKIKVIADNFDEIRKIEGSYIDLIKIANEHYDFVLVDLDKRIHGVVRNQILKMSDVNVLLLTQRLECINKYNEFRKTYDGEITSRCIPVIGKYISQYKYNSKNIARYLGQKQELDLLPFNLLYMEAAEDAKVVDLFLKMRSFKDKTDENYIFMQCTLELTNNIMKKLQDTQMRMR